MYLTISQESYVLCLISLSIMLACLCHTIMLKIEPTAIKLPVYISGKPLVPMHGTIIS